MKIEVEIPDELARALNEQKQDLPRAVIEALALEGYRSRRLSTAQVRRLLGFSTRIRVHEFLREHGVYLNYSVADLEQDIATSRRLDETRDTGSTHAA
jgi:predicted HTH domain antitoxin